MRFASKFLPACLALAVASPGFAFAPPRGTGTHTAAAEAQPTAPPEEVQLRLNYVSATWDKVLHDLAESTNSTLVVHDAPPGRYSRRDLRRHSRTEAVYILNQTLEPLGYRILEKGQYLTVIQIQRARFEYPRSQPRTDSPPNPAPSPAPPQHFIPAPAPASTTDASEPFVESHDARPQTPDSLAAQSTQRPRASRVAQAGHEQPADEPEAQPEETAENKTVTVVTKRPVLEVAQQVFAAFRDRAELITAGENQLPAFRVYRPATTGQSNTPRGQADRVPWFTIEIDSARNEFHITAEDKVADSLVALVQNLDARPPAEGTATQIVTDAAQAAAVAEQLDEQLDRLTRERRRAQQDRANNELLTLDGQAPADAAPPETLPQPGQPDASELTPDLLGNLRGDVSVQSLPDLDLLILRGNEADVRAVMDVIAVIERMAIGATPEIHLFFLQNVDSESLAALLNDVYTRLTTLGTGAAAAARQTRPVNVVAVGKPNAILILAPGSVMESVLDLAEQLDQPVAPGSEVEVFPLRHAVAGQVATMLEQFYQERVGLGTQIRVIADARTNSVIVNAGPAELREVTRLIRQVDRDRIGAVAQVKVIPLKNALADELAEYLNSVVQGVINPAQAGGGAQAAQQAGGANQALRDPKSVVLEFLTRDGSAQRLIRSGLLTDVRIAGDLRTNSLTVTASRASMPLLEELIRVLDQPSSTFADIKVIPLKNADADRVAETLQSLFPAPEEGQPGIQIAGAEGGGGGSSLVPLRVAVDARSNTIIVSGSPELLRVVEAIAFRLDRGDARNRRTEVLRLRNSPAADVATAINQFLQSQRDLLQIDPARISTSELLEQEIIVTPEPISNNLIISATPRYFQQIFDLARQLDREPAQVMIQSLIVEVTLEDTDEFGVELGFQDSVLFDRSIIDNILTTTTTNTLPNGTQTTTTNIISQTGTPGFLFNNQTLGNNTGVNTSQVGGQGLSNFALGRTNNDLGFGGLVLSASSESVSLLIRALAAHRNVRILSRPQILALDNQFAQIQVGQQVPIVNGVTIGTTGQANPQIIQDQAGIILSVTPRISPEGQIVMEITAEKSAFTGAGVPIFTDATTGNTITSPIKDITTALTSVKVPDGQTIVVGGMITKTEDVSERKVPYLADIPIIGNAFRYDSRSHRRTELLIFLTPRILRGDADMELIKQVEMERLHFFQDEAEMIHGPLMGIPNETLAPFGDPHLMEAMPPVETFDMRPSATPGQRATPAPAPTPATPLLTPQPAPDKPAILRLDDTP